MALKSNELRIGNFISHETWGENVVMEVKEISQYRAYLEVDTGYIADFNLNEANGIKITEDWLLKLGFELEYKSNFTIKYTMPDASIGYDWGKMEGWSFRYFGDKLKCEYVHQLQNLVFALKATELVLSGSEKV